MIRHSKSLFASIVLHSVLVLLVILVYQNWPESEKEPEKKIVCLQMCHIQEPEKKILEPKVVIPPPPKKIKKPKIKKEPEKKIVKKKVIKKPKPKKKKVPVVLEIPKEMIEEVVIKPKIEPKRIQTFTEHIPQEIYIEEVTETLIDKAIRIEKDYLDEHLHEIGRLLSENLYYPRSARKRGITGEVIVKFKLLQDGNIEYTEVISSQNKLLTRAAIKTIDDLSGEFPKPKEDLVLHVPINYSLK